MNNNNIECGILSDGMEYVCWIVLVRQWQNRKNWRMRDYEYVRTSSVSAYSARDGRDRRDVALNISCVDCADTACVVDSAETDQDVYVAALLTEASGVSLAVALILPCSS